MRMIKVMIAALVLSLGVAVGLARASDAGSLFVNMTTDDVHRADMAMTFAKAQMERGHPVTIFLNDRGVLVGAKSSSETLEKPQAKLKALIADGAQVIACPMCMKHYEVEADSLLAGIERGNPELTGGALFKDGTKTLTW